MSEGCVDDIVQRYFKNINTAKSIGLIIPGGIDEADFLNFLVIGKVLKPEFYCESGVFVRSSLFAFIFASPSTPVLAIDPDLQKLRLPKELLQNVKLESNFDFEELELEGANGLAYFDDHINPAARIIAANKAGFSYVAVDDAAGVQSIIERKYPAIPAVPHIMNWELFLPGESIEWSTPNTMGLADKFFHKIGIKRTRHIRNSFYFSEEVLDEMKEARQCISLVKGFPDVRDWVTPSWPRWSPHNRKYLVKLSG